MPKITRGFGPSTPPGEPGPDPSQRPSRRQVRQEQEEAERAKNQAAEDSGAPGAGPDAPAGRLVGEHGPELVDLPPGSVIHERINVTPLDRDPVNDPEYIDGAPLSEPEGGEQPSPGSNSSTSPEKPPTSPEPKPPARPRTARTTGSRSRKGRTGGSSARPTDGDPEDSDG